MQDGPLTSSSEEHSGQNLVVWLTDIPMSFGRDMTWLYDGPKMVVLILNTSLKIPLCPKQIVIKSISSVSYHFLPSPLFPHPYLSFSSHQLHPPTYNLYLNPLFNTTTSPPRPTSTISSVSTPGFAISIAARSIVCCLSRTSNFSFSRIRQYRRVIVARIQRAQNIAMKEGLSVLSWGWVARWRKVMKGEFSEVNRGSEGR